MKCFHYRIKPRDVSCVLCRSLTSSLHRSQGAYIITSVTSACGCCCVRNCEAHREVANHPVPSSYIKPWFRELKQAGLWSVIYVEVVLGPKQPGSSGHAASDGMFPVLGILRWIRGECPLCQGSVDPRLTRTASHWVYITDPVLV